LPLAALLPPSRLSQYPRPPPRLVLFDYSTPVPLSSYLVGLTVTEARNRGWDTLSNGDLLAEAERAGFDVFLTADKNIRYQQNLAARRIAVVVLSTPQWPLVRLHTAKIAAAVNAATSGSYVEVPCKSG